MYLKSVLGATEIASLRDDTRVRIFSDGTVLWIPSLKMKTTCSVDVTDFPYDSQTCEVRFVFVCLFISHGWFDYDKQHIC